MKTGNKNMQIIPSKKKGEKKATIILEKELTIFSIEKIKDQIVDTFKNNHEIHFKLKDINNMDLTFIQFLFSLKQSAPRNKKVVSIESNISEDTLSLLNNADLLKILK